MNWPWTHTHRHKPVSVQVSTPTQGSPFAVTPEKVTVVLGRCTCGDVATWMLAGSWTFDQIVGEDSSKVVDSLLSGIKK